MNGDQSGEVDPPTEPRIEFEIRGDDLGQPFVLAYMTDNAESFAARVFEKMCSFWNERDVRAAFKLVMKRSPEGRARRRRLEPFEEWMLGAYDLWSTSPDHSPDDKLGFAKLIHKRFGGQSVVAIRRQLDRLLEFREQKP